MTFSSVSCCCVGVDVSCSFSNETLLSSSDISSSSSSLLDSANTEEVLLLTGLDFTPNGITLAPFFFPTLKEKPCFVGMTVPDVSAELVSQDEVPILKLNGFFVS